MNNFARNYSNTAKRTLRTCIDDYLEDIDRSSFVEEMEVSIKNRIEELKAAFLKNEISADRLALCGILITEGAVDRAKVFFDLSLYYLALADIAESERDEQAGWPYFVEFIYSWVSAKRILEVEGSVKTLREARSRGGAIRANDRTKAAKEELKRLIRTQRPKQGWLNEEHVADSLYRGLAEFIRKNDIDLKVDTCHRNIVRWLKLSGELRTCYQQNMAVSG